MDQKFVTPFTVSAVNKIASNGGKIEKPPYVMKHIPGKWMIFEYSEWCYMPLKQGVREINNGINMPLEKYGLSRREINAYNELIAILEIEPNQMATPKKKGK